MSSRLFTTGSLQDPLNRALAIAAALHAAVLVAMGFGFEWPDGDFAPSQAVTITLAPSKTPPPTARHVAGENQLGELTTPVPPPMELTRQTSFSIATGPTDASASSHASDGTAGESNSQSNPEHNTAVEPKPLPAQQQNPRVGTVAARKALDAEYLARWQQRVEAVGNALYLNEPTLHEGDVRLKVRILADGSLESVDLLRSSGQPELDDEAHNTVILAAPFPPFPKALAAQTDSLEIVRTWQFRGQPVSSKAGRSAE